MRDRNGPAGGSAGPSSVLKYRNNCRKAGQDRFLPVWDLMRYLWVRSSLAMVRKCHRVPYGQGVDVFRTWDPQTEQHGLSFLGYCRCSSVWACPMCAPRIRRKRGQLLAGDLIGAVKAGRGVLFLTFTLPHDQGCDLKRLFRAVSDGWHDVLKDRSVRDFFGSYGVDFARATEVTWGENGFHPHLHVAVVVCEELSRERVQELRRVMFAPWCRSVERSGFRPPRFKYGLHVINVRRGLKDARALAAYMSKIQGLAQEMTRLDRKTKGKTIGPFEVLRRAVDGDERMSSVWRDYEVGTKGRRMIGFSQSWAERVSALKQPSDEELSAPDVGGAEWVGMLANDEAVALSRLAQGHEIFLEMLGDTSPEAFRQAQEWLCLQAERELADSDFDTSFYITKRGGLLVEAAIAKELRALEAAEPIQEVLF